MKKNILIKIKNHNKNKILLIKLNHLNKKNKVLK